MKQTVSTMVILPTTASTGEDWMAGVLDWHGLLDSPGKEHDTTVKME